MRELRGKIKEFLVNAYDELKYCIRLLCGKPTPLKRFVIVLVIGGILSIAYTCILVSSIYSIGKRDAKKEFLKLQHIQPITN